MSLVKTIKAMVEEGYTISFSEADLPMDGIYITIIVESEGEAT